MDYGKIPNIFKCPLYSNKVIVPEELQKLRRGVQKAFFFSNLYR